MNRRAGLVGGVIVLVLLLSACRREDNTAVPPQEEDRIVQTAELLDDPSMLLITWAPVECEEFQNVEVDLEEDFANLRIRVLVDIENCPPSDQNEVTVDLGEPLGDRRVWDRAFGDTVALENDLD